MRWLALSVEADVEAVEAVSEIFGRLGQGSAVEPLELVPTGRCRRAPRPGAGTGSRPDPRRCLGSGRDRPTRRALWHLRDFDVRPITTIVPTTDDSPATGARGSSRSAGRRSCPVGQNPDVLDSSFGDPGGFRGRVSPDAEACLELSNR